jgi:tripartite-type tricarboxylate transporter receptor subunit TctC
MVEAGGLRWHAQRMGQGPKMLLVHGAGASTHSLYPLVVARPQYDPLVDFSPVALVGANSVCVIARSDVATSLTQLVALAKARPGQLRFANPGTGTYVHMVGEYLKHEVRLDWLPVPYRGNGPAMVDLLAGQIDAATDTVVTSLPHHREGKVKILAVCSRERSPLAPEVPTVAEALGLPGFEAALWSMLAVRAGTPPELVARLHDATLKVLADPRTGLLLGAHVIGPEAATVIQPLIQAMSFVPETVEFPSS